MISEAETHASASPCLAAVHLLPVISPGAEARDILEVYRESCRPVPCYEADDHAIAQGACPVRVDLP
jgi:hypothetical protein